MNKPVIEIYNQVIKVEVNNIPVLRETLRDLCRHFTTYEVFRVGKAKKLVTKVSGRFYYLYKDGNSARFSINAVRKVLEYFTKVGYPREYIELVDKREYKTNFLKVDMNKDITPRTYQNKYIRAISGKEAKRSHLVDLPPGKGKASSVDSLVRIPNGWKRMGDISVNDKVIAYDGTITTVTGVYPQGKKQLYLLTFEDGRTHECCNEHLWKIYYDSIETIVDTKELILLLRKKTCYIDLVIPEDFEEINLPLSFLEYGKSLNTSSNISVNIYKEYLNGNLNQRLELLHGITNNKYVFETDLFYSNKNERIALYTVELIRSLGGIAELKSNSGLYLIRYKFYKDNKLKIKSITPSNIKDAQCISIDHPEKLYVVEEYVVTHNTLIGSYAIVKNRMTTAVLTKSGYLEKWVDDLNKYMLLEENDIYVLQGYDSIVKLLDMKASDRNSYKFFVMSMRTMQNYVESYMEDSNSVPVPPEELLRYLKIGTILNDESHQEFASLFKILLFLDPKRLIGLSATMESDDAKTNYMYRLIYPLEDRASNLVKYIKYINVKAVSYNLAKFRIKYKTPMGYNHIMFEKSIMQFPKALQHYMEMLIYYIETEYIAYREQGDKCLIFFASIDMCTLFTNYLASKYNKLDVRRYTQDDPYDNVLSADICISTNKSAGTAVDIPNLITAIQTVSISSTQPNIQAAGRLREIEGKTMRYICLYSSDLSVHKKMNMRRRKALEDIYKTYTDDRYFKTIGNSYDK